FSVHRPLSLNVSREGRGNVRAPLHSASALASWPCRPPKPPLLMITTWVAGATWDLTRAMIASSESQTTAGTGQAVAVAPRSQPRLGGAYQITWSAWATDSGRPSRCAPSFMELE